MFKAASKTIALIVTLAGMSMSAPPLLKTGPCPTLTRYAPPSADNWGQFPIKPVGLAGCTGAACTLQNPLTPDQSINCIQVPSDLIAQGVASELTPGPSPSMGYIMEVTFDERGRVWAAEPRDYPAIANDPNPTNRATGGTGRILILDDTDGDGSLDRYKVFYSGLVMPTSVEVVKGGVLAVVEPNIYFIPANPANPDTALGAPVAIFTGMGSTGNTWDTHGGTNSLFTGVDNWYYGHLGYNGSCTVNGVSCPSGGIWRFKHTAIGSDSTSFQSFSTGQSNAHGDGQMADGQIFQSGATCSDRSHHAIRRGVASLAIDAYNSAVAAYYPITGDRYIWDCTGRSTDAGSPGTATQSTATSGHDFYTSRLLPQRFWNTRSFTCEGASHLCAMDSLLVSGSTWSSVRPGGTPLQVASNIFASSDAWVAPFKVRTGPDGALWVVDWYNYLFLHNPASPSTNAAWNNALRTKSRTRLYRIVPTDGHTEPVLNLTNASTAQLVNALYNQNFFWRMQAQRLLIAHGFSTELRDSLASILNNHRAMDEVGLDGPVIHAIWTLAGLDQLSADTARWNPILRTVILHPAWGVRENVLKALPRTAASAQIIKDACAADDPHAHVRLQAYVALGESPAAPTGAVQGHYSGTDAPATSAFNAAGTTKLAAATPANTRPAGCPAILNVTPIARGDKHPQPYNNLRFVMNPHGFELESYGRLASGELVVYDVTGKAVFHSVYNSAKGEWSDKTAKGMNMSVYFYSFRGVNGDKFDGRIFPSQDL